MTGLKTVLTGALVLVFVAATVTAGDKIKIEKLDDLPRHTYTIDVSAVELIEDTAAAKKLAAQLKADLEADLEIFDIGDKTTVQGYYQSLGTIALLEGRLDDALAYVDKRRALEDKEAAKLTMGMQSVALIRAKKSGSADLGKSFARELGSVVEALPFDVVQDEIKGAKSRAEIITRNLIIGMVQSRIQPMLDGSDGEMSKDIARSLVGNHFFVQSLLPVQPQALEIYDTYLAANTVVKPDIWGARDVELGADRKAEPVLVAVWDSGVDTEIFGPLGQLWTNTEEIPANGVDDDENGFVDDVHGFAHGVHGVKESALLFDIGDATNNRAELQRLTKGLLDLQANIDSDEASELKAAMGGLQPQDVQPFIEELSRYNLHTHGTHVAGIAAAGNPFVRLVGARITFDFHMIPETPTIANAYREAAAMTEAVDYFKASGVRVVNMSWGGGLAGVEGDLEANNAGGTPEERKALARKIYEIQKVALEEAMAGAPEVLFVVAAGNSDNDVKFEEFMPSSFDLPNILTVGAVDQAGDETGFTSFGKVDVYANGFEVESYVPGGDRLKFSGTSMSSPNVANLAAKLLAINPELTPTDVRELIEAGCDERAAGERTVRLMNPKKSITLLEKKMG